MIYRFSITTPASTTTAAKQKTILQLARGIIHRIEIDFPAGSMGALHLGIYRGLHQVWPSNTGEEFSADNREIVFAEYYEMFWTPYILEAHTWNESLNNDHELIIRIGLLQRKHVLRKII